MNRLLWLLLLFAWSLPGCDNSGAGGGATATGAAATPPTVLMQPFQGAWKFDLQKTLAQWKADGVPAKEIAGAKKLAQGFPLHQDMTIRGDAAVLSAGGRGAEGEYAFFALHPHNAWTCGKAWHHEDRHDPGDMSKCYARLRLHDTDLHLALRIDGSPPNPGDPDVANQPPAAGSATTCGADAAPDPPWSAWRTYVFVKG